MASVEDRRYLLHFSVQSVIIHSHFVIPIFFVLEEETWEVLRHTIPSSSEPGWED